MFIIVFRFIYLCLFLVWQWYSIDQEFTNTRFQESSQNADLEQKVLNAHRGEDKEKKEQNEKRI